MKHGCVSPARLENRPPEGTVANRGSDLPCVVTFPARTADGIVELEIPLANTEHEPLPDTHAYRDRPLRWVQRKPDSPISTAEKNICQ
jgi:hypothetical protein